MRIGNYIIDKNSPIFIIAEISANHNGSIEVAKNSIRAAKEAGADCVKLQTYTPDTITLNHRSEPFKINQGTIWDGKYLYDLYKEAYTPWEWHEELFKVCSDEGLVYFSSPFDISAVDFLETLEVPAYKIASFEITDIPLIEYVASKKKPIIISTGIASLDDIHLAVDTCKGVGNNDIALLKCTSAYPTSLSESNLKMIQDLAERFEVITGLSDHTLGFIAPVTSVPFGTKIIEKHFILDKSIGGPDASFSMDKNEFKIMVELLREAESCIGEVDYSLSEKQLKSREHSRSIFAVEDIEEGEKITNSNVRSIRPFHGMHPKYMKEILNARAKERILKGTPLDFNLLETDV